MPAITQAYVLGGCRPIRLAHIVKAAGFSTPRRTVVRHALTSEILIATKLAAGPPESSAVRSASATAGDV